LLGVVDNIPLQQQQQKQQNLPNQQQQQQNPHHLHHSKVVSYAPQHHDTDINQQHHHHSMKHGFPPFSSSKNKQQQQQSSQMSDEDEPNFPAEESSGGDPKRKISPWQRMKWTDTMVRLLIMAVYYIGDEAGSEGTDPNKKKSSGLLQKKGKWKSVSRAMMEKGFYVSPQQCEDKFNDLNKRYKRVNDILGKGTACRVVENQGLLDSMDLSPKMKDEVRKLLNSKHLFFREMCAYHNSCGHGAGSNVQHQVEGGSGTTPPQNQPQQQHQQHHQQQQQQQQQQHCFHSSENGVGSLGVSRGEGLRMLKIGSGDVEEEDDEDEDDESEDFSDEDEDESGEGCSKDEEENDGKSSRKRARKGGFSSSTELMNEMKNEISGVFEDGGKSPWEKKQWIRNRIMQLEEQKLGYESQAFQLEKQRLKWARYSSKKEREMERAKLENERRRLENERMVLLIRKKEIELMHIKQQQQQHSST